MARTEQNDSYGPRYTVEEHDGLFYLRDMVYNELYTMIDGNLYTATNRLAAERSVFWAEHFTWLYDVGRKPKGQA